MTVLTVHVDFCHDYDLRSQGENKIRELQYSDRISVKKHFWRKMVILLDSIQPITS
jgi:hypothetical protein